MVALLVGAFPLAPLRSGGHDVERAREERLPLVDDAYCDADLADGGDVWEGEQIAGIAAVGIVEGNIPGQGVRVRRFPLLVRKD